jgi:hypothetical protein
MTPVVRPRQPHAREHGAALLVAVLLAAVLAVVAAALARLAMVTTRTAAAARDQVEVEAAVTAALGLVAAALATEPDLAAVRAGMATAPGTGATSLATANGPIDVAVLSRELALRRARLPPPADVAVWRPYLWGRLGEIAPGLAAPAGRDPLVVAWVRIDAAGPAPADGLELAIEAVSPLGSRVAATAMVRRRAAGLAVDALWMEGSVAGAS